MTARNSEFEITKTESEWRENLTPEQFNVLRKHGTERAHTSPLDKQYSNGTYVCAACDPGRIHSRRENSLSISWERNRSAFVRES